MEAVGLLLGSAQGVAQLAGVIKRHVASYNNLYAHASSIERKAVEATKVSEQMNGLVEMSGLPANLLAEKLSDFQDVEAKLSEIDLRLSGSSSLVNFLRAPILAQELAQVDFKLEQLDIFFRTIGLLSSVVATQREENRQVAFTIASACLSVSGDEAQQRQIFRELESTWRQLDSSHILPRSIEAQAEENFAMGLAYVHSSTGGIIKRRIDPEMMQNAVRCFRQACGLGKKEAFRYLGDIFYDGYGVHCCFRSAVDTYKEGVARGDPSSKFRLAMCHEFGHGVLCSLDIACRLFREAADEGSGEGMYATGVWSLNGQHVEADYGLAFRMLRKALSFNVCGAKGHLALCYDRGIGVERDTNKSYELLRDSFNEGDVFCIPYLVHCYDTGTGVEKDPVKGTKLYEQLIRAGTWHGKFYRALYGLRLVQGLGIQKDEARGKAIILDSTNTGNAFAWYALGECYRHGYGWDVNKRRAAHFYQRALQCKNGLQGQLGSYEALGHMFETGEGVVACAERSSEYYFSAANMLSQRGQWKSARAFERGIGQLEDLHRAVHLFKLCANSGHEGAQRKTFQYYMKGHGLERSRVHARKMMREAARQGNRDAKKWLVREDIHDTLVFIRRFTL